MRRLFSRRSRVWGRDIDMLTLRVSDPVGRGFLRSGSAANPVPRELVIRPVQGEEHRALDAVRRADGHWLRRWEATLPPDSLEHVPTFAQYVRRADIDHREGTGLIFGVQVDGAYVGQFTISNVHWGAMSTGMLGYWVLSEWAGRGLGSLAAALILDLVVGELGLHRVEVCVRPENERSLGVCRGLGLVEEGLRPRFMHIGGRSPCLLHRCRVFARGGPGAATVGELGHRLGRGVGGDARGARVANVTTVNDGEPTKRPKNSTRVQRAGVKAGKTRTLKGWRLVDSLSQRYSSRSWRLCRRWSRVARPSPSPERLTVFPRGCASLTRMSQN